MERWNRRTFIAAGLCLAGCTRFDRPPLGAIYRPIGGAGEQPPLVLIPGAFGSCLRDRKTRREVWPGSVTDLLTSDYRGLEVDIDPVALDPRADDIEAWGVFKQGLGRDFYGEVLGTLQRAGGYVRCNAGEPPKADGRRFYVYAYDWRLDNVRAVCGLHALIESIRADWGDPGLKVDVLAHSNGGLLARYYARYGTADLPDSGDFVPTGAGTPAIRRLLLVGTPNLGTMQPVLSYLRGEEIGLRNIPQEVVATCTGAPQMMPHPAIPWLVDLQGRPLQHDVFDIETWRELGWSIFDPDVVARTVARHGGGASGRRYLGLLQKYMARHLARGRRFLESLGVPAPGAEPPLHVFGGDCELTLARVIVESHGGRMIGRERVADIAAPVPGVDYAALMFEPGDAVVTRSSLLGRRSLDIAAPRTGFESIPVAHSVFLCERHQHLTGNPSFQDNLLNTLLSVDAV
jgi:pimeloyl-ACP methyl ester carboxylesterase